MKRILLSIGIMSLVVNFVYAGDASSKKALIVEFPAYTATMNKQAVLTCVKIGKKVIIAPTELTVFSGNYDTRTYQSENEKAVINSMEISSKGENKLFTAKGRLLSADFTETILFTPKGEITVEYLIELIDDVVSQPPMLIFQFKGKLFKGKSWLGLTSTGVIRDVLPTGKADYVPGPLEQMNVIANLDDYQVLRFETDRGGSLVLKLKEMQSRLFDWTGKSEESFGLIIRPNIWKELGENVPTAGTGWMYAVKRGTKLSLTLSIKLPLAGK